MSDVAPPGGLLARAAIPTQPAGVPATVINLPPDLARAAAGSILHGTVGGHDASGHPLVETRYGALTLGTNLALATGSQVTLQLRSAGPQLQVSILQVDGRPVSVHGPPPPATPAVSVTAAAADPAPPPTRDVPASPIGARGPAPAAVTGLGESRDVLALGQPLRAVVQTAADPAGSAAAAGSEATPPLRPGAVVAVRILGVDGPAVTGGEPGKVAAGPASLASAGGTGPGPIAGRSAAPAGPIWSAAAVPAAAVKPTVPAIATNTPAPPPGGRPPSWPTGPAASAAGIPLAAVVVRSAIPGQTVLATAAGVLALEAQAPLPPGTRLEIELLAPAAATTPLASDRVGADFVRPWPALEEVLRALMDAAPVDRHGASLPPGIAQPGPRLASGTLFFLSALAAGDLSVWFDHKSLDRLTSIGRGDLVTALSRDFAHAGRQFEAGGGDWRFLTLPVVDGQKVWPVRFFLRRGRGQAKEAEDRAAATRFIVEVELSRIGDLQLDGLVRPRRFDLILRTRTPLPHHMRRDIAAIYESANEVGGTTGQIAFQANQAWRPMPPDMASTASDALLI